MRGLRTIIGYSISDPAGLYPMEPEYRAGCLAEARTEVQALNHDFADEIDGGSYVVMTLFADGGAELVT